jgi:hypothetical protein
MVLENDAFVDGLCLLLWECDVTMARYRFTESAVAAAVLPQLWHEHPVHGTPVQFRTEHEYLIHA